MSIAPATSLPPDISDSEGQPHNNHPRLSPPSRSTPRTPSAPPRLLCPLPSPLYATHTLTTLRYNWEQAATMDDFGLPMAFGKKSQQQPKPSNTSTLPPRPEGAPTRGQESARGPRGSVGSSRRKGRGRAHAGGAGQPSTTGAANAAESSTSLKVSTPGGSVCQCSPEIWDEQSVE